MPCRVQAVRPFGSGYYPVVDILRKAAGEWDGIPRYYVYRISGCCIVELKHLSRMEREVEVKVPA